MVLGLLGVALAFANIATRSATALYFMAGAATAARNAVVGLRVSLLVLQFALATSTFGMGLFGLATLTATSRATVLTRIIVNLARWVGILGLAFRGSAIGIALLAVGKYGLFALGAIAYIAQRALYFLVSTLLRLGLVLFGPILLVGVLALAITDLIFGTNLLGTVWGAIWDFLPNPVRSAISTVIGYINTGIGAINTLINGFNALSNLASALPGPDLYSPLQVPTIPLVPIPSVRSGGTAGRSPAQGGALTVNMNFNGPVGIDDLDRHIEELMIRYNNSPNGQQRTYGNIA